MTARLDGTRTETSLYKRTGESVIVNCTFTVYFPNTVRSAFLCKEPCEDNLIETAAYTQRDRYAIRYEEFNRGVRSAFVTISQLTKSDSGRYTCGLDRVGFTDPSRRFDIIVTDAPTTAKPNLKNSTSVPISSTPATTPSENAPETTEPGIPLYVGLTAAGLVILLIVAVLIFCRNRSSKPEEPPEETEYASVTGTNRVYEDLREDKQSIAAPVEISSAHTEAKYTRPNGVETDHYSSVTEATSQNTAEEDSSKVTYSELNFSDQTAGSLNSAPSGHSDNVIYSLPR
uniref:uncharacterized protein n=1 Tax=Semicossyphus pulcher TaxID=241346 RepID=UPI0037E848D1